MACLLLSPAVADGAGSRGSHMTPEPWMRDLQAGYLQNLPMRLGEIRALALGLRDAPSDERLLHDLAHAVQRLVGSAGSYGFPAISEALQASAGLLARAEESRVALSSPDLAHLLTLLDDMTELSHPAR